MGAGREAGGLREKVEVLQGDPGLFSIHDSRGSGFFLYVNDLNSRPQPDLCGCAEIRRSGDPVARRSVLRTEILVRNVLFSISLVRVSALCSVRRQFGFVFFRRVLRSSSSTANFMVEAVQKRAIFADIEGC